MNSAITTRRRAKSVSRRRFPLGTLPLARLFLNVRVDPLQAEITLRVTANDAGRAVGTDPPRAFSLDTCQCCGSSAVELRVANDAPSVYCCRRCHAQWLVVATSCP